jgi:hypothetical protein
MTCGTCGVNMHRKSEAVAGRGAESRRKSLLTPPGTAGAAASRCCTARPRVPSVQWQCGAVVPGRRVPAYQHRAAALSAAGRGQVRGGSAAAPTASQVRLMTTANPADGDAASPRCALSFGPRYRRFKIPVSPPAKRRQTRAVPGCRSSPSTFRVKPCLKSRRLAWPGQ